MRNWPRICLPLLFLSLVSVALSPAIQPKVAQPSWSVKMTVEVRGEYKVDTRQVKYAGAYAFAFLWTGTMEKDDEDYLLVHNSCTLTKWEIEEKADSAGSLHILTADEFPDRPELKVNYILKMEGGLHFNFAVEGFDVPKNVSSESFYLCFPASQENRAQWAGIDYNLFVKKGSNKIAMDEARIQRGSAEKIFSWTWSHQAWVQKQEQVVFQSNNHEAKVKIEITPR